MDELMQILNDLHPDIDFTTAENLIEEGLLDSFDIVSIIAEINEVFGVAIPAEEIVPENFHSAKTLLSLIERLEEA